jgi:tetratricopeptide (TPR) repeat protein
MTPAMKLGICSFLLSSFLVLSFAAMAQNASRPAAQSGQSAAAPNPLAPGQKLISEGKLDEASAFYKTALQSNPNSWQAYLGIGSALDLKGDYTGARQNIQKAIDMTSGNDKVRTLRTMAVSYAFTNDAGEAAKYEEQAFSMQLAAADFDAAAGIADELARIYLENGDLANAQKWYETGHTTALRNPKLTDAEKDLWAFRWESAQARLAARAGRKTEAQQHVAAAKAIIDKGTNPDQAQFVPYLAGYVELYTGDYQDAINDLQKANQKDPFVLVLTAQAYEKWGDQKNATDYYRRVLQIYAHTPTGAFARPLAQKKLTGAAAAG